MSEQHPRSRRDLRIAATAGYVGGGLTAAGALAAAVLAGQVVLARRTIPGAEAPPPRSSGDYGLGFVPAPALRLAVLGDSTAAGYGTQTRAQTPGALLATWLAEAARRPVRLTCPAVVGAVSAWLDGQVETVLAAGVDLAVIFIGANDVTSGARDRGVRHLADAVRALRGAGAEVVVATCPDLGTIRPIRRPLRWLARRWSRQVAAAQTVAAVRAGARTVSLADLLGPQFDAAPERMFGADRYHPSAEGYQAAAAVVLPSALAAMGLGPRLEPAGLVGSLTDVAAHAVQRPGTEVSSAGLSVTRRVRARRRDGARRVAAAGPRPQAVPSLAGPGPSGSPGVDLESA